MGGLASPRPEWEKKPGTPVPQKEENKRNGCEAVWGCMTLEPPRQL